MKLRQLICAGGSISIALGQKSPAMHIPSQASQSPMRPADSAPHPIQSTEPLSSSIPDAFPMTAAMSAPATDMPTMEKVCSFFLLFCLYSLSHQIHGWYDQSTFPLMCCSLCCLQVVLCVNFPLELTILVATCWSSKQKVEKQTVIDHKASWADQLHWPLFLCWSWPCWTCLFLCNKSVDLNAILALSLSCLTALSFLRHNLQCLWQ